MKQVRIGYKPCIFGDEDRWGCPEDTVYTRFAWGYVDSDFWTKLQKFQIGATDIDKNNPNYIELVTERLQELISSKYSTYQIWEFNAHQGGDNYVRMVAALGTHESMRYSSPYRLIKIRWYHFIYAKYLQWKVNRINKKVYERQE